MASKIIGSGGYLPKKVLTNFDLERIVDTSDEWIYTRTGIKQRHVAESDEHTSNLAFEASRAALKNSNLSVNDIDLIIVCTTTADKSFPSVASTLQGMLGVKNIPAFDMQAVCSGFIYGLEIANNLLAGDKYKRILLVGAEKMSSLIDWQDRSTSVLFGDGAGAIIIEKSSDINSGIIDTQIYSDGSLGELLYTDGGISSTQSCGHIQMNGRAIFKLAIEKMASCTLDLLEKNNISIEELNYFIPHQANSRIMNSVAKKLSLSDEQIISTVEKHANCSAASIPLALNHGIEHNLFNKGDLIAFTAFGAGLTWGSAIYRW